MADEETVLINANVTRSERKAIRLYIAETDRTQTDVVGEILRAGMASLGIKIPQVAKDGE